MVTVKSILQSIGTKNVANACGVALRTVQDWPKNGVPKRHCETVAALACITPSIVYSAIKDNDVQTNADFERLAKDIISKWSRGPEHSLIDMVRDALTLAHECGIEKGKSL